MDFPVEIHRLVYENLVPGTELPHTYPTDYRPHGLHPPPLRVDGEPYAPALFHVNQAIHYELLEA